MNLLHSGKVRDVYADGDDLILVASDRLSIYDVVLPTPVPDKGALLTQLSLWWFDRLTDIMPNHVISASDVPAGVRRPGDALPPALDAARRVHRARLPRRVSACRSTRSTGRVSGVPLPPGLVEGSKLPEPIFTPTTKAPVGEHDEFMTFDDVVDARRSGHRRARCAT